MEKRCSGKRRHLHCSTEKRGSSQCACMCLKAHTVPGTDGSETNINEICEHMNLKLVPLCTQR